jgi:hypothetical protein
MSQTKVTVLENSLSFEELRTSIDALCEQYLEDAEHVITGDRCESSFQETSQKSDKQHVKKEDKEANTNENKNFIFSRILQKIVNFYTLKLFNPNSANANTKTVNDENTENNCDNSLSNSYCNKVTINDAEGHAKFTADDTIEYAFSSEDADVMLLLKTNDRPEGENFQSPVQQIIIE